MPDRLALLVQGFREDSRRLSRAYGDLIQIERELLITPPFSALHEMQERLVESLHTYHHALYANMGAFVKLFIRVLPDGMKVLDDGRAMPTRSITKWLAWIAERFAAGPLTDILETARQFRADFVDHTQGSNVAWDWMTYGWPDKAWGYRYVVIYYVRGGAAPRPEDLTDSEVHPYEPGFHIGTVNDGFVLPPDYKLVQHAWEVLMAKLLEACRHWYISNDV